jgi:hypothetical protein
VAVRPAPVPEVRGEDRAAVWTGPSTRYKVHTICVLQLPFDLAGFPSVCASSALDYLYSHHLSNSALCLLIMAMPRCGSLRCLPEYDICGAGTLIWPFLRFSRQPRRTVAEPTAAYGPPGGTGTRQTPWHCKPLVASAERLLQLSCCLRALTLAAIMLCRHVAMDAFVLLRRPLLCCNLQLFC